MDLKNKLLKEKIDSMNQLDRIEYNLKDIRKTQRSHDVILPMFYFPIAISMLSIVVLFKWIGKVEGVSGNSTFEILMFLLISIPIILMILGSIYFFIITFSLLKYIKESNKFIEEHSK